LTLVTAGRVGKPHGLDGSFYVDSPRHPLSKGERVVLGSVAHTIERRAGTDERPLIRLSGLEDPGTQRGEILLVEEELAADEWLAGELAGCSVEGLGPVRRVLEGPSCSLLELEDGTLLPLVSDAIESIDVDARKIRVNREFLG
jgi:16S rRNA processing protein RimM